MFLLYGGVLMISSCKRSGRGYVDGHVYETGTNIPIAGAKILLVFYRTSEGAVSQTKTDANGYFKIPYFKTFLPGYSYYVLASAPYYHISNSKKDISVKKESLDFYFTPVAYSKFHVINNTPNSYTVTVSNDDFNNSTTLTGFAYDNKIHPNYLNILGNGTTTLKWEYLNTVHYSNVSAYHMNDTATCVITLN
ncbi:MAG: carboxypeptidase-like regulatory domain-containing protein [Bacteroidota bacterium]